MTAANQTFEMTEGAVMPPAGTYLGTLVEISEPFESELYPDKPQVFLEFEIDEVLDSDDEDAEEFEGETVRAYANYVFSPKAKLREWLGALLGRTLENGERVRTAEVLGRQARLHIGPGKQSERMRVVAISPYRKGRKATVDDEE